MPILRLLPAALALLVLAAHFYRAGLVFLVPLCLGLVLLIWGITAFVSVPAHQRLAQGFDLEAHTRLVQTNWIRTLAWTARGALAIWMIVAHTR